MATSAGVVTDDTCTKVPSWSPGRRGHFGSVQPHARRRGSETQLKRVSPVGRNEARVALRRTDADGGAVRRSVAFDHGQRMAAVTVGVGLAVVLVERRTTIAPSGIDEDA